jgi:hypothetical protein
MGGNGIFVCNTVDVLYSKRFRKYSFRYDKPD